MPKKWRNYSYFCTLPGRAIERNYLKNRAKNGKINIEIDEFTPCLRDNKTGEILPTTARVITDKKYLAQFKKSSDKTKNWYVDWSKFSNETTVTGLYLNRDNTLQGLVATTPSEAGALYINWAVANPLSQSSVVGSENKQYNGIGGHLFAIAAETSVNNGYEGNVYGYASSEKLENY